VIANNGCNGVLCQQESADEGANDSALSVATQWKEDDGFRDEVRGPRKQRSRSGRMRPQPRSADDLSDEAPPREQQPHANGFAKLNGRPEPKQDGHKGTPQDRDGKGAGGLENGGDRAPPRREARPAPGATERRQGDRPGGANARASVKVVTVPTPQDKPARPQAKQQATTAETPVLAASVAAPQSRPAPAAAQQPGRPGPVAEPVPSSQELPARAAEPASAPSGPLPNLVQPAAVPLPAHQRGERQSAQRPASAEPVPSASQQRAGQGRPAPAPSHRPQPQQQPEQTAQAPAVPVTPGVQVLKRLPRPVPLNQSEGPTPAPVNPPSMQVNHQTQPASPLPAGTCPYIHKATLIPCCAQWEERLQMCRIPSTRVNFFPGLY
jgi:hypothetical protein